MTNFVKEVWKMEKCKSKFFADARCTTAVDNKIREIESTCMLGENSGNGVELSPPSRKLGKSSGTSFETHRLAWPSIEKDRDIDSNEVWNSRSGLANCECNANRIFLQYKIMKYKKKQNDMKFDFCVYNFDFLLRLCLSFSHKYVERTLDQS